MIKQLIPKNDKLAYWLIGVLSTVVFIVVVALGRFKLSPSILGFDPHIFATINSYLNTCVTVLLIAGLYFVKQKDYKTHRNVMMIAMVYSTFFLISYILHHLFTMDTHYGGQGFLKYIYYFILITHIPLAAIVLPFILLSTYRGLTGDFVKHKKIVRITYPIWLYVSITGVLVYLLISPYYVSHF